MRSDSNHGTNLGRCLHCADLSSDNCEINGSLCNRPHIGSFNDTVCYNRGAGAINSGNIVTSTASGTLAGVLIGTRIVAGSSSRLIPLSLIRCRNNCCATRSFYGAIISRIISCSFAVIISRIVSTLGGDSAFSAITDCLSSLGTTVVASCVCYAPTISGRVVADAGTPSVGVGRCFHNSVLSLCGTCSNGIGIFCGNTRPC